MEFEYERGGTLAHLAAWDVHHARLFARCEERTGIEPFDRLVEQVMTEELLRLGAHGLLDRRQRLLARRPRVDRAPRGKWSNLRLIHLPIHASWLNRIELYFSIVQRKALTPNDFASLAEPEERLLGFGRHYRELAEPSRGASRVGTSNACFGGSGRTSRGSRSLP